MLTGSGTLDGQELYFPPTDGEWEMVAPEAAGWDNELLHEALSLAAARKSTGVVILQGGRLLAEAYWELRDPSPDYLALSQGPAGGGGQIEDVASAQKSVVAVLVGEAVRRGLLSLDDPVSEHLGAGWSAAPMAEEQNITVRNLLQMSSGLAPDLTWRTSAGDEWLYNTPVYHRLMFVLEAVSGMDRHEITRSWLTDRVGMGATSWTRREFGDPVIAWGLSSSARDMARFGLLIQAGGRWNDAAVLASPEYLREMLRPSQRHNPSYGYLWWLNGQESWLNTSAEAAPTAGSFIPEAPADAWIMVGALDRRVYVAPSLNLVVVRLGDSGGSPEDRFDRAFWRTLMRAKR